MKRLSIVVPVYNEEEVLPLFRAELLMALAGLSYDWNVIFVDDGSTDGTRAILAKFHQEDARFTYMRFSRNFGHQLAITAGIDHAEGDAVVIIDSDLQDPPALIPELIARWEKGNEVVFARRRHRERGYGWLKAAIASTFYRVLTKLSDVRIPIDTGDFRLIDRQVADVLRQTRERHRFVRGLSIWAGFRQVEVLYDREERAAGKTKYSLRTLTLLALNGIFSFSVIPLRLATLFGLAISVIAFALILWGIYVRLFGYYPSEAIGWTSLVVIVLFMSGMQLMILGIFGEYLGRIYEETKGRPLYVVAGGEGVRRPEPCL